MFKIFSETKSRIDDDLVMSKLFQHFYFFKKSAFYLFNDGGVTWIDLHGLRIALNMHQYVWQTYFSDRAEHCGIETSSPDIVDDVGAFFGSAPGNLGSPRVNADPHSGKMTADLRQGRIKTLPFSFRLYFFRTGS